jgi:hypothetical protein
MLVCCMIWGFESGCCQYSCGFLQGMLLYSSVTQQQLGREQCCEQKMHWGTSLLGAVLSTPSYVNGSLFSCLFLRSHLLWPSAGCELFFEGF